MEVYFPALTFNFGSMLQRITALYCVAFFFPYLSQAQIPPIGQWRDHLPYQQVWQVTATTNKVWAATPFSIFSVDIIDNSIDRYSTLNGLSETGISAIGAAAEGNQLVIAYHNSNIDVLHNDAITNINALKNASHPGDKTVYSIFVHNHQAFLCTGLGIVVLDLDRNEVKDTWIIGNNGDAVKVQSLTVNGNSYYAATADGLKRAPATGVNLADFRNWELLYAGDVKKVGALNNQLITWRNDSVYADANFLYKGDIRDLTVSENKILLSENSRVVVLTSAVETTIPGSAPRQAILKNNEYWIADSTAGLTKFSNGAFTQYQPDAPAGIATGSMQVWNHVLQVASGSDQIYTFSNNSWSNTQLDSFPGINAVAADPSDNSIWAGSFGGGLAHIQAGNITIYKQGSAIQPAYFDATSYRVSGLAFDKDRHLWIANYGADEALVVRKADGNWRTFTIPYVISERAVSQIITDDLNQKWMVLPNGNGLVCFNHGPSVDNPADDQWKLYRSGRGHGNLPDNTVFCLAKDKNNMIWVGTARGVCIIQCAQDVFSSKGCEAVLPVVQEDNFAGYLFRDELVQCMAIDGADRKWVGTKNGVWLISADAEKTIYRFTETNSPLLSNDVKQIAIDPTSGEVFFATARGICSFRSTATETSDTAKNVLVFPNPVPPGYSGAIAIRGIANNAIVKITELDGRLVYQTRALGGQAVWNGKNYKGQSIASGVYLVLVSTDTHQEKLAAKIVFVSK